MISRAALRHVLGRELSLPPADIGFTLGTHGKPSVPQVEFNLSHSGEWALIAVSDVPLGVDIEKIRERFDYRALAKRFLGAEPRTVEAFFHLWTEREAYVKATGEGISGKLASPPPENHSVLRLDAPPGYVAALAVLGRQVRYSLETL